MQREAKKQKTSVSVKIPQNNIIDMFADDDMFADQLEQPSIKHVHDVNPALAENWDDHQGYYRITIGEKIDDRYVIQQILGKGVFSCVAKASDKDSSVVAIKFIRNNETMYRAGVKEIKILKKLRDLDSNNEMHVIRLLRNFTHRNHLCMVFETMDLNLRQVLQKYGKNVGLKLKPIRVYAHQLFLALNLLKKAEILHADIKPDNILVSEDRKSIKLADFGSASDVTENEITPYLVSRFYRAPEIILGLTYDASIDIWSVGCTLYELATGKILFPGKSNNGMLKEMMTVLGRLPKKMLRQGEFSRKHFDHQFNFLQQDVDKISQKSITRTVIFNKPITGLKSLLKTAINEEEDLDQFVDLLEKCLMPSPERRITPEAALKHPFITKS